METSATDKQSPRSHAELKVSGPPHVVGKLRLGFQLGALAGHGWPWLAAVQIDAGHSESSRFSNLMELSFPVASQHNGVDPPPDAHWGAVQICGGPMAWPSTASAIRSMFPVMKTIAKNVDPSQTQEHRVGKTQLAHGIPTYYDQISSQSCISLRYIPA